jgi:hypothetical protein
MALTNLTNVKTWLGIDNTNSDTLLTRLMNAVSVQVLAYCQRPTFNSTPYTWITDGWGRDCMILPEWPVTSIQGVIVDDVIIPPAANASSAGWLCPLWDGHGSGSVAKITLSGYCFWQRTANVTIQYTAGYLISGEPHTIPATPGPYTITTDQAPGCWIADSGVTYANGTPFVYTASSTPAQGQYTYSSDGLGVYTFNAADQGQPILVSYSYCPSDVEQVVLDMINERYAYRSRAGVKSRSLGGQESSTYDMSGIPEYARSALNSYRRSIPL